VGGDATWEKRGVGELTCSKCGRGGKEGEGLTQHGGEGPLGVVAWLSQRKLNTIQEVTRKKSQTETGPKDQGEITT